MSTENYVDRISRIATELGVPSDHCRDRGLALCEEATKLESVGQDCYGREQFLTPAAAAAWQRMQRAAGNAGIELQLVSAFRSVDYQRAIIERKLAKGLAIGRILTVSAVPGYSEHHTGRAVDLTTPGVEALTEAFEISPAFAWLLGHAGQFGFRLSYPRDNASGYAYEPWHWCFADPS